MPVLLLSWPIRSKAMIAANRLPQNRVAGVDEAGRGPLAGPVTVAAVILPAQHDLAGLTDSKRLSAKRREQLAVAVRAQALAWSVVRVPPSRIDAVNILNASLQGMQQAVANLAPTATQALIDGNRCPQLPMPAEAIVGGDASEPAISGASILAKVARDHDMMALDTIYPGYGFSRHKGYGTAEHRQALTELGACPIHRRSFAPVRDALENDPAKQTSLPLNQGNG